MLLKSYGVKTTQTSPTISKPVPRVKPGKITPTKPVKDRPSRTICTFGGEEDAPAISKPVLTAIHPVQLVNPYRYMGGTVTQRASALGDRVQRVGRALAEVHGLQVWGLRVCLTMGDWTGGVYVSSEFVAYTRCLQLAASYDQYTQESIDAVGRVCCDSEGKLNAASVMLEAR